MAAHGQDTALLVGREEQCSGDVARQPCALVDWHLLYTRVCILDYPLPDEKTAHEV